MRYSNIIDKLLIGKDLDKNSARKVFLVILKENAPGQFARQALVLLHKKTETPTELLTLIRIAKSKSENYGPRKS